MMLEAIAQGLVFAGALILIGALLQARKLMAQLPHGNVRRHWSGMAAMVILFLLSYIGYMYVFAGTHHEAVNFIVPGVFFIGACFVWITANLLLRTLKDVIRISSLERDVLTDSLTGAYNRRYLDQRLAEEVSGALRYDLPLSVLMIDIDHFKSVNDNLGHQAGDLALVNLANICRDVLRSTDIFTRYGGEEFMAILPHTTTEGAFHLAERLRKRIAETPFLLNGEQSMVETRVTVSIGVASLSESVLDVESLIRLADGNLYRAKQEGRNRVNAGNALTKSL